MDRTATVRMIPGAGLRAVSAGLFPGAAGWAIGQPLAETAAWTIASVLVLANTVNEFSIRVTFTPDAIIVRNALRRHRLPWCDVASFESAASLMYSLFGSAGRDILGIRLKDGRTIPITASFLLNTVDAERLADLVEKYGLRRGVELAPSGLN